MYVYIDSLTLKINKLRSKALCGLKPADYNSGVEVRQQHQLPEH